MQLARLHAVVKPYTNNTNTMVRESDPSTNEKSFLIEALKSGVRLDNRGVYDFRPVRITFGSELGTAEVQLGRTRVSATVTAEVIRPNPDRPSEGVVIFNTEFSPMASPNFEAGRLSEEEILVSRILEKALRRSRAIDTEGLCILANEQVWQVRIDIRILDHEGNVIDCAGIAAIAALLHFRRPDVTVVGEEVTVHTMEERNPVPLTIFHVPVCISFAFFENGSLLVVDPALLEEQTKEGDMTVTMNVHKEVCAITKTGGTPLDLEQIERCVQIGSIKVQEVTEVLHKTLKKDFEKRNISMHASNIFENLKK
ncbi:ribosomal protein S5 domain 2-type protein [Paraphysoderma sedebokerense]|nr:ribosomal protein S5 domain 2-type protein [Paraphysoderma sedebokerense]